MRQVISIYITCSIKKKRKEREMQKQQSCNTSKIKVAQFRNNIIFRLNRVFESLIWRRTIKRTGTQ